VNTPVVFINNSVNGDTYSWNFGDGATSEDVSPSHTYTLPGTYTVVLDVMNGACSSSITIEITVEVNTGVAEQTTDKVAAWLNGDNIVVEHGFGQKYPLQLDLVNEAGQIHQQMRVAGPPGRMSIPASDLASGIWYIRVSNDEVRRTIPVVIVR
ncbi:MAG TPA: PKD domain-containing protein, partial [Flavobacteriales bacterium]|nr:PKD domain-containing protein [Flavobacteriales bacterium]